MNFSLPPFCETRPPFVAARRWPAPPSGASAGDWQPEVVPGRVERRELDDDPELGYFLYVPTSGGVRARVFASIHGMSRNAREHAKLFAPLAERAGVIVVSPLFEQARFPEYHRLARNARGERPDRVFDRIVADAKRLAGAGSTRLFLFGYSGGGQFVHRYVFAHPDRIAAYAVGAPGWYTFPDPGRCNPFGARRNGGDDVPRRARFLAVPGCVLVAGPDVPPARRAPAAAGPMPLSGRGERWATTVNREARALGLEPPIALETLPPSSQSFRSGMRHARMGERVFAHLFGDAAGAGQGDLPDDRGPGPA